MPQQSHPQPRADRPMLTCPACRQAHGGLARIGNRKTTCKMCNRFAQAVRREVARLLRDIFPDETKVLQEQVEAQEYARLIGTTRRGT